MQRDFITTMNMSRCARKKMWKRAKQETLIGYLHDLGVVLNFQDDDRLRDTMCSTQVGHRGVYQLLTSYKVAHDKGALSWRNWTICLIQRNFHAIDTGFIIEMMEKFELCFEFPDNPGHYLSPVTWQKEEPELTDFRWLFGFPISLWNVTEQHYCPGLLFRMNEFVHGEHIGELE